MKWLRNNVVDIFALTGFIFLNIPAYMHSLKLGFCITGVSFLILAMIMIPSEGGD